MGRGGEEPFRVFFIPFFATGHSIPMVRLACQFAARGVDSTLLVTPANGANIRRTVDRAALAGLPVCLLHYPFPSAEVGLPEGVENFADVSTADLDKILKAAQVVQTRVDRILREQRPDAVIVDFPYVCGKDVAGELGIPLVLFQVAGAFPLAVNAAIIDYKLHARDVDGPFLVPNLPDRVELVMSELPSFWDVDGCGSWDNVRKAMSDCFGVVVNTFYELEPEYCELFRRTECRRAWFCGPFTCWPGPGEEKEGHECISWLDKQATASVVYVGFGSFLHFGKEQHWEMAQGLEDSGRPFLWVLQENSLAGVGEDILPVGFEKRVRDHGRGLVVRGWVPQKAILSHPATGAFVSHLGWNSMSEGLHAGLPMITWPLALEQFINERLVVDIIGLGVRMWDGIRSELFRAMVKGSTLVKGEDIARVVARFVVPGSGDEEVEAIRKRAGEYGAMLRAALEEGGSSSDDLARLIFALRAFRPEEGR